MLPKSYVAQHGLVMSNSIKMDGYSLEHVFEIETSLHHRCPYTVKQNTHIRKGCCYNILCYNIQMRIKGEGIATEIIIIIKITVL